MEELQEAFQEQLTQVASKGLEGLSTQVSEGLKEKIQEQTSKSVQRTAKAYAEALHPFLKGYLDSKFSTLSESIQQVLGAQVSAFSLPGPDLDGTTTTTQTSVTQSFTNTLVSASTETVSVSSTPSDLVLWRWNKTDTSQFDATAIASNAHAATLAYRATAAGRPGPALVVSASWVTNASNIGFIAFRLATSENITLPQRFVVYMRMSRMSRNILGEDHQSVGPWYHNGDWTADGLWGFGCPYGEFGVQTCRAEGSGAAIIARPFEDGTSIGGSQNPLVYPGTSDNMSFYHEAHIRPPVLAATPPQVMLNFYNMATTSGPVEAVQARYQDHLLYNPGLETGPQVGWNTQNINKFGLIVKWEDPTGGDVNGVTEITDLIITKHPTDW